MRKLARILTGTICGLVMIVSAFLFVGCEKKCEHSFGEWKVTKIATCSQKGKREHTCTKCNAVVSEEIKEASHEFGEVVYVWSEHDTPKCTATRICANNSAHVETETVVSVSDITIPATCSMEGLMTYTATFTNTAFETQTQTDAIATTSHELEVSYTFATDNLVCIAEHGCKNCEHVEKMEVASTLGTEVVSATCSTDGSITNEFVFEDELFEDQTKVVVLKSKGHKYDNHAYEWVTENGVQKCVATAVCIYDETHTITETVEAEVSVIRAADCVTDGIARAVARFENREFSKKIENTLTIPKSGHNLIQDTDNTVAKTCNSDGVDAKKCSKCDYTESETIPAGHAWNDAVPTCEEGRTCDSCGEVEDGLGHNMIDDADNSVAATCTTAGVDAKKCSRCSHTTTETINATGHEYLEGWYNYIEPKCDVAGEKRKDCTNDGCSHFESDEIAAIGHNFSTEVSEEINVGNCLYVCYHKCLNTGCQEKEAGESEVRHSYNAGEVTVSPTCSTKGQITYTCTGCSAQTEGHSYNVEIAINPHAHIWSEGSCTETSCDAEIELAGTGTETGTTDLILMEKDTEFALKEATVRVLNLTIPEGTTNATLSVNKLTTENSQTLKDLLDTDLQSLFEDLDVYKYELKNGTTNIPLNKSVVAKMKHTLSGVDMIDNIYIAVVDAAGNVKIVKAYYALESEQGYIYFELNQFGNIIVFEYSGDVCEIAGHSNSVKYEFVSGTDCSNGVREIEYCTICEAVYETTIHEEAHKQIITLSDNNCTVKTCVCGSSFEIEVDTNNLTERSTVGNVTYKEYNGDGFLVYIKNVIETANCTDTTNT